MATIHLLNTSNPYCLHFETQDISIDVLGGVRLNNLSELRVTLKLVNISNNYPLRHNLNLYHHSQVEKLIRTGAERLEMGSSIIRRAILTLTTELENYRVGEMEKTDEVEIKAVSISEKEKKEAIKFLRSKNLMEITNQLIGASGVIGEEVNRVLMFLLFTSRKMSRPLHCISLGSSGVGKTYLQSKVADLMPPEDKVEVTALSTNALYYFNQSELRHKLILIEDMDGADGVLYPLRELQSKRSITKTIVHKDSRGRSRTIHIKVEGPVCVAGCTTKEQLYEDNANRSFLLHIDESEAQNELIMEHQRLLSAGKIEEGKTKETTTILQNIQRMLEPIKVVNPYAEQLRLPPSVFKPRRTNAHYLQFIEAVTFYHQHQREYKIKEDGGESYIETTIEDIEIANRLMKDALLQKSDGISGACRNYLEKLKCHLNQRAESTFNNAEIRRSLRIAGTTLRRYHRQLLDGFYIKRQGSKSKGYRYEITNMQEYQVLQKEIDTTLDDCLATIKDSGAPLARHS